LTEHHRDLEEAERSSNNEKLADQILTACLNVKEGENVWIHGWDHTIDLASEIAFACKQKGAQPFVTIRTEDCWIRSLRKISKDLLETLPTIETAALGQTDVFIFLLGPKSSIDWSTIPSEKRELANIWFLESNNYMNAWRDLAKKKSVRMLGVEYCLATKERAQALGLVYEEWKEAMLAGCLVNQQEIARRALQLAKVIRTSRVVSIETPSGTKLKFKLGGREPILGDSVVSKEDGIRGIVKFLPSGFVEVAADEESAVGTVVYDAPILIRGKSIKDLTLHFKHGKIVKYSAWSAIEEFEGYLKSNGVDVDRFAFFGLGLNAGLKFGFTQDDKVLGGVTIGIGGNEDKGGKNRTPGNRHWWASMTNATVSIDGKTIVADGFLR
jgi:leucyl aminopeptidase (aminopeptidase T)